MREAPSTSEVCVLVAGGDPGDLAVLQSIATAHDFRLDGVGTTDLIDTVRAREPDAVVLDVKQRGSCGLELCAQLKADPAVAGVPVILISTLDGPDARRRAHAAGCDDYVEKPFNRSYLGYRLRSLARLRRTWSRGSAEASLATLARFVRARDHARSSSDPLVARCRGFTAHLGLTGTDRWALEHAAALHDLGERAVPAALITAAGPRSPEESALLRRHTDLGAGLVEGLPGTSPLAAIMRHHHERWDGAGYPDRLTGEHIPYLARVFRVLDVHDALLRTHEPAEALVRLRADGAGGGGDPALVVELLRWLALTGTGG